jgi:hypothetical protein
VDPDRQRGVVCFWWYVTFAIWKVAFMAVVAALLIMFLTVAFGPLNAAKNVSPPLQGILMTGGVGFGLSLLASYVSIWSAQRSGICIWLGSAPHSARTGRYWPPCEGKVNFAPYVMLTTLMLSYMLIAGLVAGGLHLVDLPRPSALGAVLVLTLPFVIFFALVRALSGTRCVVAQTLEQCWPLQGDETAREVPDHPP